jgi:hypothetical protein
MARISAWIGGETEVAALLLGPARFGARAITDDGGGSTHGRRPKATGLMHLLFSVADLSTCVRGHVPATGQPRY